MKVFIAAFKNTVATLKKFKIGKVSNEEDVLFDFEKAIDTLTITLQEPGLSQNQAKRISELLRTLDGAKGTDAKE